MRGGLILLLSFAAFPAFANVPGSNYTAIPERNVFALKEPARPAPVATQEKTMPKVALNGITTILGRKQALLKVAPADAKTADQVESVIMGEGERQGPVEVLQINADKGTVRVVNAGTPMTITFEETPSLPAPTNAGPNMNQQGRSGPVTAGILPYATNAGAPPMPFASRFPYRTPRTDGASTMQATNTPPPLPGVQGSTPSQQFTPEERAVLSQVQEQMIRENAAQQALPQAGTDQQYLYQNQPTTPLPPRAITPFGPTPPFPVAPQ